MKRKTLLQIGLLVIIAVILSSCEGAEGPPGATGPQGDTGPPGSIADVSDLGCTDCHNDTSLISGVEMAWSESSHGTGDAYLRGTRASCAGCHSGGSFSEMIAEGLSPNEVEVGDPSPTRQDCRTCHQVHTTYTGDDFALETIDPVALFAFEGQTFDGGEGNLCANCHQPRKVFDEAVDGVIEIGSHWGPHYGVESVMLLGFGGAGDVDGSPSKHATTVDNTCVDCHLGEDDNHSFEPSTAACLECHDDVENFDLNGVQTEIQALLDELEEALIANGLLDEAGHASEGESFPEAQAAALWNWIFIAEEDGSLGIHNPAYTIALLEFSLAVFD